MLSKLSKALLFPAVLSQDAERLIRHSSVREAMRRLLDGDSEATATVEGRRYTLTVRDGRGE